MINKPHAIVFMFDDNYFDHFRACINSLRTNYREHPPLLALYSGSLPGVAAFLDRNGVARIELKDTCFTHKVNPGPINNSIVFARLALWTDAFREYETLLYLDADTLILRSLSGLFETGDFFIVSNHEPSPGARIFEIEHRDDPALAGLLEEDGLEFPGTLDDMANAGVFAIPVAYRNAAESGFLHYLADRYGPYVAYADQSLISLWCKLRGIRYSHRFEYNYQSPFVLEQSVPCAFDAVRILHFSHHKPGSEHFDQWNRVQGWQDKLRDLYTYYRDL